MSKRAKLNTIRIISGHFRGRRLEVLDADGLRPTTDRVRETVFNWLMHDIAGVSCLDLFAGSGVLGFECLSRNAKFVQFVELNQAATTLMQQNVDRLLAQNERIKADVSTQSALKYLSKPAKQQFDLVFLDPPFASSLLHKSIDLLVKNNWLSDQAVVYIECAANDCKFDLPECWSVYRQGEAGQSAYFLYNTGAQT